MGGCALSWPKRMDINKFVKTPAPEIETDILLLQGESCLYEITKPQRQRGCTFLFIKFNFKYALHSSALYNDSDYTERQDAFPLGLAELP